MQEAHQHLPFALEQQQPSTEYLRRLSSSSKISDHGTTTLLELQSQQQQQTQRQRSISNQSRSSSESSSDSRSTTASVSSASGASPPLPPRHGKKHPRVQSSRRINNNREATMMRMNEMRPPFSTSSNSMYLENGEPSKQRLGIDPKSSIHGNNRGGSMNTIVNPVHYQHQHHYNGNNMNMNLYDSCASSSLRHPLPPSTSYCNHNGSWSGSASPQHHPSYPNHLQRHVSFATSPGNNANQNQHVNNSIPLASTTPEMSRNDRRCIPPPPSSTTDVTDYGATIEQHQVIDGISTSSTSSPFSPSTLMMTPSSHSHHDQMFNLSASSSIVHRNPNKFNESQARPTHTNSNSCGTRRIGRDSVHSGVPRHQARNMNAVAHPSTNRDSNCNKIHGVDDGVDHQDVELNCTSSTNNAGVVNNKDLPSVTPVKTGKKVQYRKTKVCPWNGHGRCVMGDQCNYAHSKVELRGRPDLTKTRLCPDGGSCTKPQCRFAHDVAQLRATGAFFRTKMCKFWMRGHCPSGDHCRHAHGEEQLRHPETIGPAEDCESPREAILLSELCNRNSSSLKNEDQQSTLTPSQHQCDKQGRNENENYDHNNIYHHQQHMASLGSRGPPSSSPTSSLRSSSFSFSRSPPATAERQSFHQKHITESNCFSSYQNSNERTSNKEATGQTVATSPIVGSQPVHDDVNDEHDQLVLYGTNNHQDGEELHSILQLTDDQQADPINDTTAKKSSTSSLLANLSDEALAAAVSDYLLLSNNDGGNNGTTMNSSNFETTTASTSSLLRTSTSLDTTSADDEEMNRLVEALTSSSTSHINSHSIMIQETPYKQQTNNNESVYEHQMIGTPSPTSMVHYNNHGQGTTTSRFILSTDDDASRIDSTSVIQSVVHKSTRPSSHHSNNAISNQMQQHLTTTTISQQQPPPLMFPSPDAAMSSSAADLKLNDILNIAVASQDPDLLECSAKILRASLQYKKKQQQDLLAAQHQQQQHQQQQSPPNNSFFARSLSSSFAPSSTTSTAVSSLPASPRLATLYGQHSLFDNHNNGGDSSLWGSRKSE